MQVWERVRVRVRGRRQLRRRVRGRGRGPHVAAPWARCGLLHRRRVFVVMDAVSACLLVRLRGMQAGTAAHGMHTRVPTPEAEDGLGREAGPLLLLLGRLLR